MANTLRPHPRRAMSGSCQKFDVRVTKTGFRGECLRVRSPDVSDAVMSGSRGAAAQFTRPQGASSTLVRQGQMLTPRTLVAAAGAVPPQMLPNLAKSGQLIV